jgi:hypothetical protein
MKLVYLIAKIYLTGIAGNFCNAYILLPPENLAKGQAVPQLSKKKKSVNKNSFEVTF